MSKTDFTEIKGERLIYAGRPPENTGATARRKSIRNARREPCNSVPLLVPAAPDARCIHARDTAVPTLEPASPARTREEPLTMFVSSARVRLAEIGAAS